MADRTDVGFRLATTPGFRSRDLHRASFNHRPPSRVLSAVQAGLILARSTRPGSPALPVRRVVERAGRRGQALLARGPTAMPTTCAGRSRAPLSRTSRSVADEVDGWPSARDVVRISCPDDRRRGSTRGSSGHFRPARRQRRARAILRRFARANAAFPSRWTT